MGAKAATGGMPRPQGRRRNGASAYWRFQTSAPSFVPFM